MATTPRPRADADCQRFTIGNGVARVTVAGALNPIVALALSPHAYTDPLAVA